MPSQMRFLPHPPEPRTIISYTGLNGDIPRHTASNCRPTYTVQNQNGTFAHWGQLKPHGVKAPFTNWFFSRDKEVYIIGGAGHHEVDIRVVEPVIPNHQCTIVWTPKDDSVRIIDRSGLDKDKGTFVNGVRLKDGIPWLLHHGDKVRILTTPCMGPYEDLTFVWLKCDRRGWLPHDYYQYDWPPSKQEHWDMGQFD